MSRFFQGVQVGIWTEASVVIFSIAFLVILAWVYLPSRRSVYENAGKMPLED